MSKQNLERRFFAEVRAEDGDEGGEPVLRGYAARFNSNSVDLGGFIERIAPGAFADSLARGEQIHALWSHDPALPLGSTRGGKLKVWEDVDGLAFELNGKRLTPQQIDAVRDGDMQMSFGFYTREDSWDRASKPPVRTLHKVDLFELSAVAMPAYPETSVALRSLEAAMATDTTPPPAFGAVDASAPVDPEDAAAAVDADTVADLAPYWAIQRDAEVLAGVEVLFSDEGNEG